MEPLAASPKPSKRKKIILISISVVVLLLFAFPFLLNIYLKEKLPDLINEKTPYHVDMDQFNFDLISGDLHIKDVKIKNKNPQDTAVTQISGKVGELEVADFGVIKAVFSNSYKAKLIKIKNPNLNIQFAKKKDDPKKNNKKPDIFLNELLIENGEIKAVNHLGKSVFNGNKINVDLQDIDLNNDDNSRLPLGFSKLTIHAENLVVTVNDYYQVLADKVNTVNKEISIENLHLSPTQAPNQYNAKSVFDFKAKNFSASNLNINRDSLIAEKTFIDEPNLTVTSTNKKVVDDNPKELNLKIALKDIDLKNGKLLVQNPDNTKTASADRFNINITKIVFDKNTVKEKIPFKFDQHNIDISKVYFRANNNQEVRVGHIFTKDANLAIDSIELAKLGNNPNENIWSGFVKKINIQNINPKLDGQKINLNLNAISVDDAKIAMTPKTNKTAKKQQNTDSGLALNIGSIKLNNAAFQQLLPNGQQKMSVANINAAFNNFKIDATTQKNKTPFTIANHDIKTGEIFLDAGKYYTLRIKNFENNGKQSTIKNLAFKSKYSRKEFSRVIAKQEDLYDITANSIQVFDQASLFENHDQILLSKVIVDGVNCSIYHDLAPPEDHSARNMFSEKLRNIKIPLFVNLVQLKNSYVSYEEDAVNNNKPGKLFMNAFNADIKNVGNGKVKGTSSHVNIDADFKFYGTAPTKVNWNFDVMNKMDEYKINGKIEGLSANEINLFVRPYLNLTLDGKINYLRFNYSGNKNIIRGDFFLNYNDIYVNFLNKKGEKRKLLNKAVNVLVKSDSKNGGKTVQIEKARDADRSFFNMLWQGIMEGLKKTLISEKI
ncbi:hypothetical protein [Soonwooa sp.]|uniref:hypothetical protein n=1 Tax=Soonwooa sp. TaxID=1938592 RepID=UPI0026256ECB|nr:hypothetical protein [Soonwooa sp.]